MKILQINSVCGHGSTGSIVIDLHLKIKEHNIGSYIAYGRGENLQLPFYKIENDFGVYSHVLLSRFTDRQGFYSKKATEELVDWILQIDPDVIHLHNIHGYYLNLKILFAYLKQSKKKIIWTFHDCWPFTGHCSYFDAEGCNKWKQGCYQCKLSKAYPKSLFLDQSRRNFIDKKRMFTGLDQLIIVTPSNWLKAKVKESFFGKYKVEMVRNGIDLDIFRYKKSNIRKNILNKEDRVILGVAGIWTERKGLKDFLKLSKIIEGNWKIVLVGLTSQQKRNLPHNVIGFGCIKDRQLLAKFYSMADVYVNASIEETMGMTTAEAMACGTPVVVYDSTAVPEIVPENVGIVVEKNNVMALKKAIGKIFLNRDYYSRHAFHYAKENLDKRFLYAQYIDLYKR